MKVLFLSNLVSYTYNFRKEIIDALKANGHEVLVVADNDDNQKACNLGCRLIEVPFDGKSTKIKKEIVLLTTYSRILKREKPDIVLSFTIKMNLYGGLACIYRKIPFVPMITGLGELEKKGKLQMLLLLMHRFIMPRAKCIFFQNQDNKDFFTSHKIHFSKFKILPGSGINTSKFTLQPYPTDNSVSFAFIGRVTKAKGIDQYLQAANELKGKGYLFYVAGKCDREYENLISEANNNNEIKYLGMLSDTRELLANIHCLVLPTFHPEGMSNVLLEASAMGRPSICTDRPGCKEIVEDGKTGFYCKAEDSQNLVAIIEKFASLPVEEKVAMGLSAREKIEKYFDREIVVKAYLEVV